MNAVVAQRIEEPNHLGVADGLNPAERQITREDQRWRPDQSFDMIDFTDERHAAYIFRRHLAESDIDECHALFIGNLAGDGTFGDSGRTMHIE